MTVIQSQIHNLPPSYHYTSSNLAGASRSNQASMNQLPHQASPPTLTSSVASLTSTRGRSAAHHLQDHDQHLGGAPNYAYGGSSSTTTREYCNNYPPAAQELSAEMNLQEQQQPKSYNAERVIGNGSFGIVYMAEVLPDKSYVAIKKVFQDKRYRNRELHILQELQNQARFDNGFHHPNIIKLNSPFHTQGCRPDELFLNLVMEYVPDTLYNVTKHLRGQSGTGQLPEYFLMLYTYQLLRALAHLKGLDIMHRDIKPQNLLVDMERHHILKLCDFGSAKKVDQKVPSVQYICSRYYRSPELIFGSETYDCAIDVWSAGCVMGELMNNGAPIFPGQTGTDQLVEIIKVVGTPEPEDIEDIVGRNTSMAKKYHHFRFRKVHPRWIGDIMPPHLRNPRRLPEHYELAFGVLTRMLVLSPRKRVGPVEALADPYFDRLRKHGFHEWKKGVSIAPPRELCKFTTAEKRTMHTQEIRTTLLGGAVGGGGS